MFFKAESIAKRKVKYLPGSSVTRVTSAFAVGFWCASSVADSLDGQSCGGYVISRKEWQERAAERFQSSVAVSIPIMLVSLMILVAVFATRRRYSWIQLDGRRPSSARHALLLLWLPIVTFVASLFLTIGLTACIAAVDRWLLLGVFGSEERLYVPILLMPAAFCISTPLIGKTFGEDAAQFWVWCFLGAAAAILSFILATEVHPLLSAIALSLCFACVTIAGRARAIASQAIKNENTNLTVNYWKSRTVFWWIKWTVFGSAIWLICVAMALSFEFPEARPKQKPGSYSEEIQRKPRLPTKSKNKYSP